MEINLYAESGETFTAFDVDSLERLQSEAETQTGLCRGRYLFRRLDPNGPVLEDDDDLRHLSNGDTVWIVIGRTLWSLGQLRSRGYLTDVPSDKLEKDLGHWMKRAIETEALDIAELVIGAGLDLNAKGTALYGATSFLFLACAVNSEPMVRLLLTAGANPDRGMSKVTPSGSLSNEVSPLWVACANGDIDIARTLLAAPYNCDPRTPTASEVSTMCYRTSTGTIQRAWASCTTLCAATRNGKAEMVRFLLDVGCGADANVPDRDGKTPLWLACSMGYADIAKMLLEAGAEPSVNVGCEATTPLYMAVHWGYTDIVTELLARGAHADTVCGVGLSIPVAGTETALECALRRRKSALAQLLLDHGATTRVPSQSADSRVHEEKSRVRHPGCLRGMLNWLTVPLFGRRAST